MMKPLFFWCGSDPDVYRGLLPVTVATNYEVVYLSEQVHDDDGPPCNVPPEHTLIQMSCTWYDVDDGYSDGDGKASIMFQDPIPFPDGQGLNQWFMHAEWKEMLNSRFEQD